MGYKLRKARRRVFLFVALGLGVLALCITFRPWEREAAISFSIVDGRSGSWIPGLRVILGDRIAECTYGKDFTFRDLRPGTYTARVSAPSYEPLTFGISLRRGGNRIAKPLKLKGFEIPGLSGFSVVEIPAGAQIVLEVRPIDSRGEVINRHPCIDTMIFVQISRQFKNGIPVHSPTEKGAERGEMIFQGIVPWEWEEALSSTARYRCVLPWETVGKMGNGLFVFDYLIVVSRDSADIPPALKDQLSHANDVGEVRDIIERGKEQIAAFEVSNWNVGAY